MTKVFHQGIAAIAKCFSIDTQPLSREWSRIYKSRLNSRGKADAVKFMKQLNTAAERYALHQEIEPIPWTKSNGDGFPVVLNRFKPYLRSQNTLEVVMALSVMRTVELLRLEISKDIATVTDPCQANDATIRDIVEFIPIWVKSIPRLHLSEMNYHMTAKNGPNGPALRSSDLDILALVNCPKLLEAIRVVENKLADKDPMDTDIPVSSGTPVHSKLTQFPEKAGKTRTIAVVDYYSQRCLNPLHKGLMQLLKRLVSDGTYSHLNVGKYAEQLTKEKSFIACADLTAATDRFPAIIQRELLSELLQDSDLSTALWTLLAERTFTVAWSGEQVTYNCGQPMGAHGSWPLFALAHHLVVEYAAYKCNIPNAKSRYRLIGDDVIISEEAIWYSYQDIMLNLGLTINRGKTVISSKSSVNSGAEVAKQLYLNGKCLTPLTPGFISDLRKPYMFNTCARVLSERYCEFQSKLLPCLIDNVFPKRRRRLVWLLSSNPIGGILKPGIPGYEELSPWCAVDTAEAIHRYRKIAAGVLVDKAQKELGEHMFLVLSGGSPWKLNTPPPRCLQKVYKDQLYALRDCLNRLKDSFFNSDLSDAVEVVSYIPRPSTPYMERTELKCLRMSTLIIDLYKSMTSGHEPPTEPGLPGIAGARVIGTVPIRPLS